MARKRVEICIIKFEFVFVFAPNFDVEPDSYGTQQLNTAGPSSAPSSRLFCSRCDYLTFSFYPSQQPHVCIFSDTSSLSQNIEVLYDQTIRWFLYGWSYESRLLIRTGRTAELSAWLTRFHPFTHILHSPGTFRFAVFRPLRSELPLLQLLGISRSEFWSQNLNRMAVLTMSFVLVLLAANFATSLASTISDFDVRKLS